MFKARPLCTATAVDIFRTLKGVDMDIRRTPGTQLANDRTGDGVYIPPEGEARLRDMLANWERFLHNQTDLDPSIRMAVWATTSSKPSTRSPTAMVACSTSSTLSRKSC